MGREHTGSQPVKLVLHVILEQDSPDSPCVAHCLEFDIVCTAPQIDEALTRMDVLILSHLKYARENNLNPNGQAPPEAWEKWWKVAYEPSELRSKKISDRTLPWEAWNSPDMQVDYQALCHH